MRKLFFLFIGIILFSSLNSVGAITERDFYFDGFESNNLAANWTANAKYSISTLVVYAGTYAVLADGGNADVLMTITSGQNVSNQTSCNLTSVMQINANLDGGEYLCMDYSNDNGATWNRNTGSDGVVGGLCQDGNVDVEGAWRNVSYSFSPSGIQSFKFRFRLSSNNVNEDGYIDNVNLNCSSNDAPTINNITASNSIIKGGNTLTIYANTTSHGVNDTENDTLYFYCDSTNTPNSTNTDCTGGITSDSARPYILTCTYTVPQTDANYTEYCRLYDGNSYSSVVNASYTTDSTAPVTSIVSVEGDSVASYFDNSNNGKTDILISGESNMLCRWSSSDVSYSSMSNDCSISGIQGNCSVNDVIIQGFATKYISCQDSLGNEQNSSNNLNVQFYLDYTPPNTTDNSISTIQNPGYNVTITESDNVDLDPTTYYCTSTSQGCNPTILIDNGGVITYTTRGANYLRYYSIDDAGNIQTVVNKTININQIPVLTSASDNALIIKGGTTVNVSTVSYDLDPGQEMNLFVCSSPGANSSGCLTGHYCNSTSTGNMSCAFTSEIDSSAHTWYAYIFDDLGEPAIANPITGSYTTDSQAPTITLANPLNNSNITQSSTTFTIVVNEALTNSWYSLDAGVSNVSMTNVSLYVYTHSNTSIADGSYNMTFWANDSYGNINQLTGNSFTINTLIPDTTAPLITIISPVNNSYYNSASILLNITTNEPLSWAGYKLDSDAVAILGNVSAINWNATIILTEGQHNITFYANDSSSNKNQANKSILVYIDLTNPSVDSFSCTNVNDSQDVNCSAAVSDSQGLNYAVIGYNATGSWQNSSQISLSGISTNLSYLISAGNTTPGSFVSQIYLYDLSGRGNLTTSYSVNISDDTFPTIWNITYSPNTTESLDSGVRVYVNATVIENYKISKVELMWQNLSDGNWISVVMTNNSAIANGSSATVVYNASFLPEDGNYSFKINATDLAGNMNISNNITISIANESSFWNGTTMLSVKSFTYTQRGENNTLGIIYINNTGDQSLDFNLSVISSIQSRFNINYTNDDNATYSLNSGENLSLTILVNTTGLTAGLYPYNIIINSGAGTTIYEKQLNIQTAEGPYLQVSIDTFSSSVTTSQTGVSYIASVTNLGTQDATDVYLNWTLPNIFTLASGSLSRSLGNLPIGSSGTNSITINVGSSTSDISYYINATATSSNANSVNASKKISVSNPVTITQTVTSIVSTGGGGGGGAATGGAVAEPVVYSKVIEIVRGGEDNLYIEINNKYVNSTIEDLTINLTGFLAQYISISPSKIDKINSKEIKKFNIKLKIPSYKESYEEHTLKAVITGKLVSGTEKKTYSEIQNIKLIIQEISKEKSELSLTEAEEAVLEMKNSGFNVQEVSKLLEQSKDKLSVKRNKESWDLSQEVINIKNKAVETDSLIRRVAEALQNPQKSYLLVGKVVEEFKDNNKTPLKNIITGNTAFDSESTRNLLQLAIAAFERGDYNTAEERAKSAQSTLLLERKGNVSLFFYLYWQFVLMSFLIFIIAGIFAYKRYQKSSVTNRIQYLNREEDNIKILLLSSQRNYFTGKISAEEYHKRMNQHRNKLAEIKKERLNLRNKRIKILEQQQVLQDLKIERMQIENEIKKLQEKFYRDKKISEKEYETEFKILNERLAEIEEEKITLEMLNEKRIAGSKMNEIIGSRKEIKKKWGVRITLLKMIESLEKLLDYFKRKKENSRLKEEIKIKEKIRWMKVI